MEDLPIHLQLELLKYDPVLGYRTEHEIIMDHLKELNSKIDIIINFIKDKNANC